MAATNEKKFTVNSLKLYSQALRNKFRTLNDARYLKLTDAGALATKDEVAETDLATALATKINNKADAATTIAGYGITDAYTKTEVDAKITSTYKAGGNKAFAELPTLDASLAGYVYNVTDGFTTTADFVEGAGKVHGPGANVAIVEIPAEGEGDPTYKFDVLAGFIDTSNFLTNANFVDITQAEIEEIMGEIVDA